MYKTAPSDAKSALEMSRKDVKKRKKEKRKKDLDQCKQDKKCGISQQQKSSEHRYLAHFMKLHLTPTPQNPAGISQVTF